MQIFCIFLFNLQQYENIPFQDPLKKMTAKALMSLLTYSSSTQSYACKGKDHFTDLQQKTQCGDNFVTYNNVDIC